MEQIILSTVSIKDFQSIIQNSMFEVLNFKNVKTQHDEYITRNQAAEILGVSLPTLHIWTNKGLLQSYKINSRVRYNREEVLTFLRKGKDKFSNSPIHDKKAIIEMMNELLPGEMDAVVSFITNKINEREN